MSDLAGAGMFLPEKNMRLRSSSSRVRALESFVVQKDSDVRGREAWFDWPCEGKDIKDLAGEGVC
jgi:hypothetical protein